MNIVTLKHDDRLVIPLPSRSFGSQDHNFTVVTVDNEMHGHDAKFWVGRSRRLGHKLVSAFNEGFTISAHKQTVIPRIRLHLGDVVEFGVTDLLPEIQGRKFRIEQDRNNQIKFVEISEG